MLVHKLVLVSMKRNEEKMMEIEKMIKEKQERLYKQKKTP
jgi:hypothetical protein